MKIFQKLRPNLISRSCSVVSEDAYGMGRIESFGCSEFHPEYIFGGVDMKKIVGQIARHYLGNRGTYLIGTLTLIEASKKYDVKKPCTPAILSPIYSNDYELQQLTVSKGCQAHALSMGLSTFIAGNAQTRSGGSKQACVWLPPNEFRFLSSNEGLESSANWVSPLGHACGYSVNPDGRKVACSWRLDDWSDWS